MKPFQVPSNIEQYKIQLRFDHTGVNCSAKIWYFWRATKEILSTVDAIQHVILSFKGNNVFFMITGELWDELQELKKITATPR